ncbi:MAG: hypothetical protein ACTSU2_11610 [Promethearchaeota archaeon]
MIEDIVDGAIEIFNYKGLLEEVVMAAINTPEELLDKIFPIFEEFEDLVSSFNQFTEADLNDFINNHLLKYIKQPFFPILAGLYVNAMVKKLLENSDEVFLDIEDLCFQILEDAKKAKEYDEDAESPEDVAFSLDFLGYLLPENKHLIIKGPVGDYCGALMEPNSKITLMGYHGKHLGYAKDPSATIEVKA